MTQMHSSDIAPDVKPQETGGRRPRRGWRRWLRGWWWKLPLAGLVLLTLAYFLWHAYLDRQYQHELARIRAAGQPASVAELKAYFHPGGPNPAPQYRRAFEEVLSVRDLESRGVPRLWAEAPTRGEPLTPEAAEAKRAAVEFNAEALRLIREANAAEGEVWFDRSYDLGLMEPMSELGASRAMANALNAQAQLAVEEGDSDAAMEAVLQIKRLNRAMEHEPSLIGQLVRISIDVTTVGTAENMLARTELREQHLAKLQQELRRVRDGYEGDAVDPFVGERVLGLADFDRVEQGRLGRGVGWFAKRHSGLFDADRLLFLDLMQRQIAAAGKSRRRRPDVDGYIEWKLNQDRMSIGRRELTRALVPFFASYMRSTDRLDARLRVAEAGVAVERFRRAEGRLPRTLEELVPGYLDAVPADPFDDADGPLRLRVVEGGEGDEGGAVVYSVGTDGHDDGGRERDVKGNILRDGTDITFTLGDAQEILFPRAE